MTRSVGRVGEVGEERVGSPVVEVVLVWLSLGQVWVEGSGVSVPEAQPVELLAAQPAQGLLGRVLQVVGALVVHHQGQDLPRLHTLHTLNQASALVLTAVGVKPGGGERDEGREG